MDGLDTPLHRKPWLVVPLSTTHISLLCGVAFAGFLWYTYKTAKDDLDATPSNQQLDADKDNVEFLFYASIAWSVVGVRSG